MDTKRRLTIGVGTLLVVFTNIIFGLYSCAGMKDVSHARDIETKGLLISIEGENEKTVIATREIEISEIGRTADGRTIIRFVAEGVKIDPVRVADPQNPLVDIKRPIRQIKRGYSSTILFFEGSPNCKCEYHGFYKSCEPPSCG
jgi:hypothetical protein